MCHRRLELAGKRICELEDRLTKITHWRTRTKGNKEKWTQLQRNVESHIAHQHICNRSARSTGQKKRRRKYIWIIAGFFPNLLEKMKLHISEAQWAPNIINAKRCTPWHIIIQMLICKNTEKILKAARWNSVSLTVDSLSHLRNNRVRKAVGKIINARFFLPPPPKHKAIKQKCYIQEKYVPIMKVK